LVNVARIRGFLLQLPKPSLVRVSGDGEPQDLKPGKSYAKCAESIAALRPELIECMSADGKLLRAMRTDAAEAQRSDAAAVPEALAQDPQAMMLTHFANLLHRAYEHSTEIAFCKMVELVERMGDRSEQIEQRLERTEAAHRRAVEQQIDDAFARAEEMAEAAGTTNDGGMVQQMAGAFLSGALQPKPKPPAKTSGGTSNGKGQA
jgi:DNA-binding protein H-NS